MNYLIGNLKNIIRLLLNKFDVIIHMKIKSDSLYSFLKTIQPIESGKELIRIGGNGDGGYLIPDDLEGIDTCFSPGVANVSEFERDLVKKGIKCFCADGSVSGINLENSDGIFFTKKHLGIVDSNETMTLDSWIFENSANINDSILQMDIESAEYSVLIDTSNQTLLKFRIMVIEFHGIHSWINAQEFKYIKDIFQKILKNFHVVHIHPNNVDKPLKFNNILLPGALEITFLRKDRFLDGKNERIFNFPHHLDRPNVLEKKDTKLTLFVNSEVN
jgi:hypothetical protein